MQSNSLRVLSFVAVLGSVAGIGMVLSSPARSQIGSGKSGVLLQGSSPGTQQSGHVHISGVSRASFFVGAGGLISNLNANSLTVGTVPDDRLNVAGDLAGPLSASSVIALRGRALSTDAPLQDQVLKWNGSSWIPSSQALSFPYYGSTGTSSPETFKILNTLSIGAQTVIQAEGWSNQAVAIKGIGNTGVLGTTTSGKALVGEVTGTSSGYGLYVTSNSASGPLIYGRAFGGSKGMDLLIDAADADGLSVSCLSLTGSSDVISASTSSPNGYGVRGTVGGAGAGTGVGVFGLSAADSGIAVQATASGLLNSVGLNARTSGATGIGVKGAATHTTGASFAGWFENLSTAGVGIYSNQNATTGTSKNVELRNASPNSTGIYARNYSFTDGAAIGFHAVFNGGGSTAFKGELSSLTNGVGQGVDISATSITSGFGFRVSNQTNQAGTFNGLEVDVKSHDGNGVDIALESINGYAIEAQNTAIDGRGVRIESRGRAIFGEATNTVAADFPAIAGVNRNREGAGVYGFNSNNVGGAYISRGVQGEVTGPAGRAVTGFASSNTGPTFGGRFTSQSDQGIGVYGQATSNLGTGSGVRGVSESRDGYGVHGEATNSNVASGAVGVFGQNMNVAAPNTYAMFGNGNIGGSLKSFVIDHPQDPLNRILRHYCTEGPEPLNVFKGSVRTDEKGYAVVRLPDYYESANRDGAVTLTVVDDGDSEDFVMAKVIRGGIQNGQFTIRTSVGNTKVFWRVEAVRDDPYIQLVQPKAEYEKPASWRGRYLNPQAFGAKPEQGIHFRAKSAPDLPLNGQTSSRPRR